MPKAEDVGTRFNSEGEIVGYQNSQLKGRKGTKTEKEPGMNQSIQREKVMLYSRIIPSLWVNERR